MTQPLARGISLAQTLTGRREANLSRLHSLFGWAAADSRAFNQFL
jgi:hypothetical protein